MSVDLGSQFMKVAIVKVTMTLNTYGRIFWNKYYNRSLNVAYKTITPIRKFGGEENDNNDNTVIFMRLLH